MPLKHLRVCESPCNRVRFAACSKSCALPVDTDPENWRVNLQEGAGTIGRMPMPDGVVAKYDNTGQLVETGTVRDGAYHRHPMVHPGIHEQIGTPA
jgi:hypothetical protein